MRAAFYYWRANRRHSARQVVVLALICGLLGGVALGGLAGARRTDSAYARYLRSINSSDVLVNVPGPFLGPLRQIQRLPAVQPGGVTWVGLNADPIVHGRVRDSFLTNNLIGSLDGGYFRGNRMTVLAGHLPRRAGQIALTSGMAAVFGVSVGGRVTWQLFRLNPRTFASQPASRVTFTVTAIVAIPPVLVDEFDQVPYAVLPPAATRRVLDPALQFGWAGLRLRNGIAGLAGLQHELVALAAQVNRTLPPPASVSFNIRRLDTVHHEAQQSIRPQAIALALFGMLTALALLVLAGQGLAQLLGRSATDLPALRASGASRAGAAVAIGLDGAVSIAAGILLAAAGAMAVSPLAPVGRVRTFDPARGFRADPLVLAAGSVVLAALLLGILGLLAWRSVRPPGAAPAGRASGGRNVAAATGLPVSAIVGIRSALARRGDRGPAPVAATLAGTALAVTAVVAAVVFGASLNGLTTHPARYGWNWSLLLDAEGGYGHWQPGAIPRLLAGQPEVTGWSTFSFTQLPVDGQEVPVLGLDRHQGSVQPPTTSGHPLTGPDQIELGPSTLRLLGKKVGDRVCAGAGRCGQPGAVARELTVVGTVTLPSIGLILADHVSLGRGGMLPERTLLAIQRLPRAGAAAPSAATVLAYPSAVAISLAPGYSGHRLGRRVAAAEPDGRPGGTYPLSAQRGAAILYDGQMGSQPLVLALAMAGAAVLSLALALLSSVRQRRHELALLKALGLTRRQVRATLAWQASSILLLAVLAGVPLGVAGGRWAWSSFASSLGVVPVTVIPAPALLAGALVLLIAGNLLTALPATVAARTRPAALLRTE
jgi:hypothetical protein